LIEYLKGLKGGYNRDFSKSRKEDGGKGDSNRKEDKDRKENKDVEIKVIALNLKLLGLLENSL
jgi:hypothetical protein